PLAVVPRPPPAAPQRPAPCLGTRASPALGASPPVAAAALMPPPGEVREPPSDLGAEKLSRFRFLILTRSPSARVPAGGRDCCGRRLPRRCCPASSLVPYRDFKASCDYLGPTQIIQETIPILRNWGLNKDSGSSPTHDISWMSHTDVMISKRLRYQGHQQLLHLKGLFTVITSRPELSVILRVQDRSVEQKVYRYQ
ncbi:unnamed protein product, partial [Gulo gulo]